VAEEQGGRTLSARHSIHDDVDVLSCALERCRALTQQDQRARSAEQFREVEISGRGLRVDQYRRGELVFDVIDAGLTDGPVVILLHGFPQMNTSWDA